jgi:ABC-type dipeptide/oligopeptide/nickel transport system ATPase subunit
MNRSVPSGSGAYNGIELRTRAGDVVPRLKFSAEIFLNKTAVLYGSSGTGKSVCIKNIMMALKDHVDKIIVVSPTEPANQTYGSIVPAPLIHTELYMADPSGKKAKASDEIKGAVRFLESVYNLQQMVSSVYYRANAPNLLESLFHRVPDSIRSAAKRIIDDYTRKRDRSVHKIKAQYAYEEEKRKEIEKSINSKYEEAVQRLYKKYIRKYSADLSRMRLSEDEQYALQYLDFNPHLLLILDDCASHFKSLVRNQIVRALFYQGRHVKITTIIACQDDTDLPPNLKKNAFVSMFTDPVVTTAMFNRASNNSSKPHKDLVNRSMGDVFVKHRKFAYIREDPSKQHFYIVDEPLPPKFRFGSAALRDLCDMVRGDENRMDDKNPYYKKFKL